MACDAAENYMFLEFTTGVRGWIVVWESSQELQVSNRCKIEQPDTLQHNGIKNSEMEMCMQKYFC